MALLDSHFFIIVVYICFIVPKALLKFCLDSSYHVKEKEQQRGERVVWGEKRNLWWTEYSMDFPNIIIFLALNDDGENNVEYP